MPFVTTETENRQLASQLRDLISRGCREVPEASFDYRAESGEDRPRTTGFEFPHSDVWFLYFPQWDREPSFIFGRGRLDPRVRARATVEVNLDKRRAGAFAYDDHGCLLLTHNGRMGGGKKGITKEGILNADAMSDIVVTLDGTRVLRVAQIGNNAAQTRAEIVEFVNRCERAKEELASSPG